MGLSNYMAVIVRWMKFRLHKSLIDRKNYVVKPLKFHVFVKKKSIENYEIHKAEKYYMRRYPIFPVSHSAGHLENGTTRNTIYELN